MRYDAIILGQDLLKQLNLGICYSDGMMHMEGGRQALMKKRREPLLLILEDDDLFAAEVYSRCQIRKGSD
jgi:hypothetical protein